MKLLFLFICPWRVLHNKNNNVSDPIRFSYESYVMRTFLLEKEFILKHSVSLS